MKKSKECGEKPLPKQKKKPNKKQNRNPNKTPKKTSSRPIFYKTEECRNYLATGTCPYRNRCTFAHGQDERKPRPAGPKYKTAICKSWKKSGTCSYGQRCLFIHPRDVLSPPPQLVQEVEVASRLPIFQAFLPELE